MGSGSEYELRWFTPAVEVDLCGHATLAASFVLYRQLKAGPGPLIFHSQSGELQVRCNDDIFFLDFPSRNPEEIPCPDLLARALGAQPVATYAARDLMAVFEDEEEVRKVNPDFSLLVQLDYLGCIVTAPGKEVDFVSRFCPGSRDQRRPGHRISSLYPDSLLVKTTEEKKTPCPPDFHTGRRATLF